MQDQSKESPVYPLEKEFSFSQMLQKRKEDLVYLWKYRAKIGIACLIGAVLGAIVSWCWPVSYTSRLTFVVEENKAGGGLASALAGQFGFDLNSMGGTGGVLAGDNVQALLHSEKLIKKTLLTPYSENSNYSLADRYTETYKLKEKWIKHSPDGKPLSFPVKGVYTRLQDSLIKVIIEDINEKELSVSKPDKKLSFFEFNVTMRDEKLSQLFCTRLINEAKDFYIQTKTGTQRANIKNLQARADSITRILNKQTYSASVANQILLDANPAYPTTNVNVELQERDKMLQVGIYQEIIKNLEISKTMLAQETPTIQIVDEPVLPLKINRLKYSMGILLGMAIAGAIFSLYLLVFKK